MLEKHPDFNLDDFLSGSWGIVKGERAVVRLEFSPKIARFISEVTWHPSQELEERNDGTLLASFEVMGLEEIKRWILGFGSQIKVLEPKKLREQIKKEAEEIRKLY